MQAVSVSLSLPPSLLFYHQTERSVYRVTQTRLHLLTITTHIWAQAPPAFQEPQSGEHLPLPLPLFLEAASCLHLGSSEVFWHFLPGTLTGALGGLSLCLWGSGHGAVTLAQSFTSRPNSGYNSLVVTPRITAERQEGGLSSEGGGRPKPWATCNSHL